MMEDERVVDDEECVKVNVKEEEYGKTTQRKHCGVR
jgi:hypothetical protein